MNITDLPQEVLANIFKSLDVRSRVRCESVCKKFSNVASLIYASHSWNDFPNGKITLIISAWCRFSDALGNMDKIIVEANKARITILNRGHEDYGVNRRQERFSSLLASILTKFVSHIDSLEIHNAELSSESLKLLLEYRGKINDLKILGCKFNCAGAGDVCNFISSYGEGVVFGKDCDCGSSFLSRGRR